MVRVQDCKPEGSHPSPATDSKSITTYSPSPNTAVSRKLYPWDWWDTVSSCLLLSVILTWTDHTGKLKLAEISLNKGPSHRTHSYRDTLGCWHPLFTHRSQLQGCWDYSSLLVCEPCPFHGVALLWKKKMVMRLWCWNSTYFVSCSFLFQRNVYIHMGLVGYSPFAFSFPDGWGCAGISHVLINPPAIIYKQMLFQDLNLSWCFPSDSYFLDSSFLFLQCLNLSKSFPTVVRHCC